MKISKDNKEEFYQLDVGGRTKLFVEDIAYFEADLNYTIIHLVLGEKKIVATTLGEIQSRIPKKFAFVRPNRKYLINLDYINTFSLENLLLHNDLNINISRRRKSSVNPIIGTYFENRVK